MIPVMASVSTGGPLADRIQAIAEAGFQGIELFDTDLTESGTSAADLRAIIRDAGLTLVSYFPLRNFEGMPDAQRPEVLDRAARYLDLAGELGAGMVMACSNTDPESLPDAGRIAADLNQLGVLGAERGLKIAYEGLTWGRHVHDYRIAWDLVRQAGHANVGLVLDSFHILAPGFDIAAIQDLPPERIFLVQISDAPLLALDYPAWSRHHRTLPGRGAFALGEFTRALRATSYDGIVSLECFSDQLKAEPAGIVAKAGFEALGQLWTGAASVAGK